MKILIINGPNINMLGIREPDIYGRQSYSALCDEAKRHCEDRNAECEIFQSNHEGSLVDRIQQAYFPEFSPQHEQAPFPPVVPLHG